MLPKRPHTVRRMELKREAARQLRLNATEAERKLWYCLRDRRLLGLRFRRHRPIHRGLLLLSREADYRIGWQPTRRHAGVIRPKPHNVARSTRI